MITFLTRLLIKNSQDTKNPPSVRHTARCAARPASVSICFCLREKPSPDF